MSGQRHLVTQLKIKASVFDQSEKVGQGNGVDDLGCRCFLSVSDDDAVRLLRAGRPIIFDAM